MSELCGNCLGADWVCENHHDRPWGGMVDAVTACECGAGVPCPVCSPSMACAKYTEPMRDALKGVLWMAEEWFEHNGSSAMNSDEYETALNRARAAAA